MTHPTRPAPRERLPHAPAALNIAQELAALRAEPDEPERPHRQKTIFKNEHTTIAIFAMEPGAALPEHAANGTVCVQPLDGLLEMTVDGETHTLRPGEILVMAPGARHDVRAAQRAAFLLQVHNVS